MQFSDQLKREFTTTIRHRGDAYFRQNRVTIEDVFEDEVWGTVEGTEPYEVMLGVDLDTGRVGMSCTCPHFARGRACKHLWAFLRQVDVEINESGPFVGPLPGTMTEDDMPDESDDRLDLPWRENFALLSSFEPTLRLAPQAVSQDQSLHYFLTVASLQKGELGVRVAQPRRYPDGDNGPLHILPLDVPALQRLSDADRQIATLLLTVACAGGPWSGGLFGGPGDFAIPDHSRGAILPAMLDSGRCYYTGQDRLPDPLPDPLANALDETWHLVLRATETADGYDVEGELACGEKRCALSDPLVIQDDGLAFWSDRVTRFDMRVNFGWVVLLLRDGTQHIPHAVADAWLRRFYALKGNPPADFPPALRFEPIAGTPTAVMRLNEIYAGLPGDLYASLSFRYGDVEVAPGDPQMQFPLPESRQIIERDMPAEREVATTLNELGFVAHGPLEVTGCAAGWQISRSDATKALGALMQAGVEVYMEATRVRSGSVSINVTSGTDWFDVSAETQFDAETVKTPALLSALAEQSRFVQLSDGSLGLLDFDAEAAPLELLAKLGKTTGDSLRFGASQVFLLDALLQGQPEVDWDAKAAEARRAAESLSPRPSSPPDGFVGSLRDYQREGLGWLQYLQSLKLAGCLADDMGLGKTVQALAMLLARQSRHVPASLVVLPKSLIFNWCDEADRFTPALRYRVHHGQGRARTTDVFDDADLVFTTYGTMRRDAALLSGYAFDYIILDEAQAIKNAATATAKAARLLRGAHRLAMSGTPIENHLGELWSLFEFLNPGMLGQGSWLRETSQRNEVSDEARSLIARAVRPFILRRTKEQVASELPPRTEETIHCELPAQQRAMYKELRDYYHAHLTGKIDAQGMAASKMIVLEALLRLRQTACHPALVDANRRRAASGKLNVLMDLLGDLVPAGHKVLVFSQFTRLLDLVKDKLDSAGTAYAYLDGKTRDRRRCVEAFQSDPNIPVFLISLKAGGTGLNLTAADYVILLDPWWNPAVESQAIDRTHRIGQERHVFAYRLVAKDTVEEKILALQASKRDLADAIITQANGLVARLSREDLDLLLS